MAIVGMLAMLGAALAIGIVGAAMLRRTMED